MRIFPRSYGANVVVQRFIVIIALVVLFGVFSITTPKFFTLQNVITVALQTSTLAFMGIGVTYVIITGVLTSVLARFWHSVVLLRVLPLGLVFRSG